MIGSQIPTLVIIIIASISYPAAADLSTRTGQCYGLPTYAAIKSGDYQCKLWQPNWASETLFELTFKHCQENPTINLLIRNFYGADEINTDFNPQYRKLRFTLYTGRDAQFIIVFKKVKGNKKHGIRPQVRVLVIFKPEYFLPDQQQLLTGVFYTDMKDDCNVFDKMEPHNLIIMWLGLVLGLVVIPIIVFVILKWRRAEAQKKDKKKTTFCKWFFKCDQGQNRNNKNEEHEMNGDAPTDRLI